MQDPYYSKPRKYDLQLAKNLAGNVMGSIPTGESEMFSSPKMPNVLYFKNEIITKKWKINLLCFKASKVLDDLFQPCEFVASHQYSPWWSDVVDLKVNSNIPFSPAVFSFDTGIPSLYQITTGLGKPDALQLIFTSLPAVTYI